jgi:hypothetical protein
MEIADGELRRFEGGYGGGKEMKGSVVERRVVHGECERYHSQSVVWKGVLGEWENAWLWNTLGSMNETRL